MASDSKKPFWERPLDQLTSDEWERLCDGCGRCCLHKLEDEDTEEVYYTRIACTYLDISTCRCTAYMHRAEVQPECVILLPANLPTFGYLPETCAYRLRSEGRPLPVWHPLVTGDPRSIHLAGIAVSSYALSPSEVSDAEDLEDFVIDPP